MSDRREAVIELKPLTREGFFAYFDQMADGDGQILTSADWLADTAMLIVHEARQDAGLRHAGEWVAINGPDDLPKEAGTHLFRRSKRVADFYQLVYYGHESNAKSFVNRFSHYKRISPPTFEENNDNAK